MNQQVYAPHVLKGMFRSLLEREVAKRIIPMLIWCPQCHARHVDEGIWETNAHHTHACQECGMVWRPAIEATVGVRFLPGFKNP